MSSMMYTFRTFPAIDELKKLDNDIFVFSKLKEDLIRFEKRLDDEKPNYILGVALTKGPSRIESVAINQFNTGRILSGGKATLQLCVPTHYPTGFTVATKPTNSFCNWSMYRVQNLILERGEATKFSFVHVNIRDIAKLKDLT